MLQGKEQKRFLILWTFGSDSMACVQLNALQDRQFKNKDETDDDDQPQSQKRYNGVIHEKYFHLKRGFFELGCATIRPQPPPLSNTTRPHAKRSETHGGLGSMSLRRAIRI